MSLIKFNESVNTIYSDNVRHDLISYSTIISFRNKHFSHVSLEEFLKVFKFKKVLIERVPKEFGMSLGELGEFTTVLFLDDLYALVNIRFKDNA